MGGLHLAAHARALVLVKRVAVVILVALCCPAVAIGQTVWVDDPVYPVIVPPGDPGPWDDGQRNPLAVIKVDGVYHLYFNGQPSSSQTFLDFDIGHAWSTDGIVRTMDPENPVLTRGALGTWDDGSLWGAAVISDGSEFKMWYCGLHFFEFDRNSSQAPSSYPPM
jgi:hypothetical protein